MIYHSTVVLTAPLTDPPDVGTPPHRNSALGFIVRAEQLLANENTIAEWVAPTFEVIISKPERCKHGLNVAWCATCKEQQSNVSCVDARGTAKSYKKTKTQRTKDKPWSGFPRCTQCGESFLNEKNEQTLSEFAFCGETALANGTCKNKWLKEHKPASDLPKPVPRFQQVTPEDVDWARKQSGFLHHRPMTAKKLAEFFANHKRQREKQYEHERALQALALSLGDEWAATHPEMEATMAYFAPKKVLGARDVRAKQIQNAQRKRVLPTKTACLHCGDPFEARKGTKFCSDDCRKRHHEAANNTRS